MKTSPIAVTLIDSCGSDLTCVNAARVSFAKESKWEPLVDGCEGIPGMLSVRDTKLINYLAKHKHTSPFNHAFLSFRVKAPIFVARQLVKHKFLPWNEVSRRYVDEEPEFYFPDKWRGKAVDRKQGSSNIVIELCEWGHPESWVGHSLDYYRTLISGGVAPEQARMVLPQNIMTEWIWSGTLGAWCDMLRLRLSEYTQEETREVAFLIAAEVKKLFPVSYEALLATSTY